LEVHAGLAVARVYRDGSRLSHEAHGHPVYVIGMAAMLTMRLVLPLNSSAAWQALAAHITAFYETPAGQE
jgi:hypothetical protein